MVGGYRAITSGYIGIVEKENGSCYYYYGFRAYSYSCEYED